MNWIILIFVAVAVAGAGFLIWRWIKVGQELAVMRATETSMAKDIAAKPQGALVELKGSLRVETPLKGEFSGEDCVYYRALVERQVRRIRRDSQGRSTTETHYETVSNNERFAPCVLEDASGSVPLDFTGAKVEGVQSHQRFESGGLMGAVVGGVIGSVLGGGENVLGHRYTEWVIRAGVPVYVLATATGNGVGADSQKKNPFIVSHKSEEQRERSLGWTRIWLIVGAVACVAAAGGLLYLHTQTNG